MVIVWDDPFVRHNPTGIAVERLRKHLSTKEHNYVVVNVFGTQPLDATDCVQRVATRVSNFAHFQTSMEQEISRSALAGKGKKTPKRTTKTKDTPNTSARKTNRKRPLRHVQVLIIRENFLPPNEHNHLLRKGNCESLT